MDHSSDTGAAAFAARVGRLVEAERLVQRVSARELAERSGLSRTILARIEKGEGNPSIGTLWRIAKALEVPLGVLMADDDAPRVRVLRRDEGDRLDDPSGLAGRLLHADARERRAELFDLHLPAGARHESPAHQLGVEELVVVTQGRMEVDVAATDRALLDAGDAALFTADRAHAYAAGDDGCRFLNWILYPA